MENTRNFDVGDYVVDNMQVYKIQGTRYKTLYNSVW